MIHRRNSKFEVSCPREYFPPRQFLADRLAAHIHLTRDDRLVAAIVERRPCKLRLGDEVPEIDELFAIFGRDLVPALEISSRIFVPPEELLFGKHRKIELVQRPRKPLRPCDKMAIELCDDLGVLVGKRIRIKSS